MYSYYKVILAHKPRHQDDLIFGQDDEVASTGKLRFRQHITQL